MNKFKEPINGEIGSAEVNPTPSQNAETAALAYAAAGISVLPLVLPEKKPVGMAHWTPFQNTIASPDEIKAWFTRPDTQVGIICGRVTGNLEGLDFDEKYNVDPEPIFKRYRAIVDKEAPGLIDRLVLEKTVTEGYHLLYRCDLIEGNQKLAMRPATTEEIERAKAKGEMAGPKTLIETRGEGGYFMCVPSKGYEILQGSLLEIPRITVEERRILMNAARIFDEVVQESAVVDRPPSLKHHLRRPGDDFNLRGDIHEILVKHGWKMVSTFRNTERWLRPGKSVGVSATFNFGKLSTRNLFYVFSSNAHPFEANRAYTMFSAYTMLEHSGDWEAAAKVLAKEGFGATVLTEAEEFLTPRFDFQYNIVTGRTEYRLKGSSDFVELKDLELNSLYRLLHRYHIGIGIDILASLLHSDFVPSYDPFKAYYNSLPAWDGKTDYIAQLASTVTLKDPVDAQNFSLHLTKWLVNAVACALYERDTNQNALILVGPQGWYKTTWLNKLLPAPLERYKFVGTINPDNKDTLIHLAECFLINLDELETLKKADVGSLKSIMTLQHIRVRRPYGRIAENLIRRASFVGSINRSEFLNDETGSRRFLTYEIESIDIDAVVDMDGVHAQAYRKLKDGFKYWFDRDEICIVNEHNEQFSIRSTEAELVEKLCRPASVQEICDLANGKGPCVWKSGTEVALRANSIHNYPINKNSARDFGIALKKAGFISKRSSKSVLYATVEL